MSIFDKYRGALFTTLVGSAYWISTQGWTQSTVLGTCLLGISVFGLAYINTKE